MSAVHWPLDPYLLRAQQAGVLSIDEAAALNELRDEDEDPPEWLFEAVERLAHWDECAGWYH